MKNTRFTTLSCFFITILLSVFMTGCCKKPVELEPDDIVTISPEGGEYTFPDEILLKVPAGAVTENKDIMLRKVGSTELTSIFNKRGVSLENLLACIECTPDGTVFNYPVQLFISVDLDPGEIPFVHEINLENGSYTPAKTEIICDPEQDTLMISLSHFSSFSVEIVKEFEDIYKEGKTDPCRSGRKKVEQHDKDFLSENGDCQITETKVSVTFLDCPGTPVEESTFREVSAGCSPNLNISAASTTVSTKGQTRVTATVVLGREPTEGQSVDFSISGPASVNPTYATTNVQGEAHTTFTAGDEEGIATVTARSTVSYYTYSISAHAAGQHETINGPLITKELNESVVIEIKDDERWSGTMNIEIYFEEDAWECNFCLLHQLTYSVDFNFIVTDFYGMKEINGTATARQEVKLSSLVDFLYFPNIDAPQSLDLIVYGFVEWGTNKFMLMLEKYDFGAEFYKYKLCIRDEYGSLTSNKSGIYIILIGEPLPTCFIPLSEGTYSYTHIDEKPKESWANYKVSVTITLHRDE